MPSANIVAQTPIASARWRGSANMLLIRAKVDGINVAPATPSAARTAISIGALVENAASTEAMPNAAAPAISRRRRPIRSPSVPMVTRKPAIMKPYASMIHSAWTLLACRSAASAGSARYSRVTSNPNSRVGNASTARPSPSRVPAAVLDTPEDPDTAIESMSSLARGETTVLGELYRVTILPIILLSEATAMAQRSLARSRPELSAFLLQHRRRLAPADVGLPPGGRRRTPGLRREEVAALAGVGLTWYTWFEQGRGIGVSESFLLGVARALRLDDAECCHLFLLAQGRPPPLEAHQSPALDPLVQRLMDDLPARPAYILDLRWDVVAWNA